METEKPEIKHRDNRGEGKYSEFWHARSASSSSSSSSGALLEPDTVEHSLLHDSFGRSNFNEDSSHFPEYIFSPSETPSWSMLSATPSVSLDPCTASLKHVGQDTRPPPVQMMERPDGYDPGRIPASVFSDKPENPLDWSNSSNDSLFSIQHSFSRKSSFPSRVSGEFPRLNDLNNSKSKLSDAKSDPSRLPPLVEVTAYEESSQELSKVSRLGNQDSNSSVKMAKGATSEHHAEAKPAEAVDLPAHFTSPSEAAASAPHISTSNHRLSDESSSSFAFPV